MALVAAALPLGVAGCRSSRLPRPTRPVVLIQTRGGFEQGVVTTEGLVFLGRTAAAGPVKVLYDLEGAPLIEDGEIGRNGGPLAFIDTEVPLPAVPISFVPPKPGETLRLALRHEDGSVEEWTVTAPETGPVRGEVVLAPGGLELRPEDAGAGLFRDGPDGARLVGLVKAVAEASDGRRWLLLAGPTDLAAALLEPKPASPRVEYRYRPDGTRIRRIR